MVTGSGPLSLDISRTCRARGAEVGQYGEDAAMSVLVGRDLELE
jgi:hypothetical protein